MKAIIDPIPIDVIKSELTRERFIRNTNNSGNEIYIINHHNSPNVMLEIGRLRELAFRVGGGGTGESTDIDHFDTKENPYEQLIVWDPDLEMLLGGYRFFNCKESRCIEQGKGVGLSTGHLFRFSEKFITEYLPYTIELGRSFVHPEYQSGKIGRKGIFALDNLWDGLGALIVQHPNIKYFFGKITMYPDFHALSRDLILFFMHKHFKDHDQLVMPIEPLGYQHEEKVLAEMLVGANYDEDYKIMSQFVRSNGRNIPPLFSSYMNLSASMKCFGTAINSEFGSVEETGILITIGDIFEGRIDRHIVSYQKEQGDVD